MSGRGISHEASAAPAPVLAVALALSFAAAPARAYSYESPVADGCHEAISIAALRAVRARGDALAPWPTAGNDRLWIDDLPLELPRDARDLGAATLIVGVRDNDLKGTSGLDTSELALVHGNPAAQMEHCLRRPEHDEPDGSAAALAECRAFIRDRVRDALRHGLDARGRPDPQARIEVAVHLAFAGEHRVPMPRFYVQLGRALHALQDSFAHALRSEDGLRVRALLNWVDFAAEHHDEARDGPVHRAALDRCQNLDPLRARRLERATTASSELLAVASEGSASLQERLLAIDVVLDRYLSYEPGCGADNGFCDAPELAYPEAEMGCAAAPGRARGGWTLLAAVMLGACVAVHRRRRCGLALGLVVLLVPAITSAQAAPSAVAGAAAATPPGPRTTASEHEPAARPAAAASSELAIAAELGAAVDQASAAIAAGARYRASERWLLGLSLEWNPWVSLETARTRSGTLNAYATAIWRAPLTAEVALRITGHFGAALLLFDAYGAPSGSLGPYVGLSLLALELALGRNLVLILEPADVVVAMPHVTGIPLTRRQYRASVGIELWL